jgi:hypothetical protein
MTYENNLTKWLGLAGLMLAIIGCTAGDDGDTGGLTTSPLTTGVAMTDDSGTTTGTTGDGSTGTPMTTTGQESSDGADSSGGVTCDPPCEVGQECIAGECFGGESSTGEPPPTNSDYGPCNMCAPGESPVMIGMIDGCFCSPACDGMSCPAPNEGTGQGMCVLELMMGAGPTQCALICATTEDCPAGAICEDAGGAGVCVHPAP